MIKLNFPDFSFKIKSKENRDYIFDEVRKKYVRLNNEEWVRQNCIKYIVSKYKYPISHINVEKTLVYNNLKKRYDIVVFDKNGDILILIECKSTTTKIYQKTFDQIFRYNLKIKSKFFFITNGLHHYKFTVDYKLKIIKFIDEFPKYKY
tara:strand:+ start:113738 stop:114184 length:447 start_codon:yes stop_codon:yes gene_type:complete